MANILVIDDNRSILVALKLLLSGKFDIVTTLSSPKTLLSVMREHDYDVVLLDMNFNDKTNTGNEGLFWLSEIKKNFTAEVVLFTAFGDIELAVNGIKRGAYDFIVKPWDNERLVKTLSDAAKMRKSNDKGHDNKDKDDAPLFWGTSPAFQMTKSIIQRVAPSDASILITGENGTGKSMIAREIHQQSLRRNMPFVTVDIGSLSGTLFESELFGHVKGSFTDAYSDHIGKFELANNGTIFLDEIGNIPLNLQTKLLHVLQDKTVSRVGDNKEIPINVRLICATNMNLQNMVMKGSFREDLFYRINTINIKVPSLRECKDDIVPLAELFMHRFAKQYNKNITGIDDDAKMQLSKYQWGGNIRELRNCMERAVILCASDKLDTSDFQLNFLDYWTPDTEEEDIGTLDDIEKNAIMNVIKKYEGNLSLVAKHLGISRQTLYNKINKYGL